MNVPKPLLSSIVPMNTMTTPFPVTLKMVGVPAHIDTAPSRSPSSSSSRKKDRSLSSNSFSYSIKSKRNTSRSYRRKPVKREHLEFADYDTVFQIPHINDMSEQEIHDCWMSAEDLRDIRKSCIGTVRSMNKGEPPEGMFLRGLDQHSDKYRERKDEINNQIYDAVYRIQEFQRLSGKDASEVIAKMCAKYSEPSVVAAHMAAISDIFSSYKGTWSRRAIPDAAVFEENPEGQGTYNY